MRRRCRTHPALNMLLLLSAISLLSHGNCSITVIQSPGTVVSEIGQNVTLSCQFIHTPDEDVRNPILYWYYGERELLYPLPQRQDHHRVLLLDPDPNSSNRSIVLLDVQWEDRRRFHCMLSYTRAGKGQRSQGAGVELIVHDLMLFDYSNDSHLLCRMQVSAHPSVSLSIAQDDVEVIAVPNTHNGVTTHVARLPVTEGEQYICKLKMNSTVVLSKAMKRASKLPEPVMLYAVILLIPAVILIIQNFSMLVLLRKSKE